MGTTAGLKRSLETVDAMDAPRHVYEVIIPTTPEKLWQAITDPNETKKYFYGNVARALGPEHREGAAPQGDLGDHADEGRLKAHGDPRGPRARGDAAGVGWPGVEPLKAEAAA